MLSFWLVRLTSAITHFITIRSETQRERKKNEKEKMGFVLRVRLASFFTGAAVASFLGLYILHNDYKVAHDSISQQV